LDRRTFLAASGGATLAGAAQSAAAWTRPKALRPGDRVGVIAPSSPIYDPAAAGDIRAAIEALGLVAVLAPHLLDRSRDFQASRRERLADLHGMFADPSIKGVFCARGGAGITEIISDIDFDLIRRNPKVFLGFSDPTLLHLAIHKRARLVTFHGHMPALRRFSPYCLQALRRAVCLGEPLGLLQNPPEANPLRPAYPLRTIAPGSASGRLVGGNLSMIIAAMGTPWEIDTRGAILFLEDVNEQPYAIGRMLFQLRHAGKLGAAAGVIMGACAGCDPQPDSPDPYGLNEQFDHALADLGLPVFSGLAVGHTEEQLTLPLGVQARMDADARTLTVLESGVVA
jgi:muramoyltetrapeptide carboxypeptidase